VRRDAKPENVFARGDVSDGGEAPGEVVEPGSRGTRREELDRVAAAEGVASSVGASRNSNRRRSQQGQGGESASRGISSRWSRKVQTSSETRIAARGDSSPHR